MYYLHSEHLHYLVSCCLAIGDCYTLGSTCCKIDHFVKRWVLKSLYRLKEKQLETHRSQDNKTYLVSWDQPFYDCLTKSLVWVRNYSFQRQILQMAIECVLSHSLSVFGSLLGCFSSSRKFAGEIVTLAPLIVDTLFEKSERIQHQTSATYHMSRLNMTTQRQIMLDNSNYRAFFSVNM